LNPDDRTRREFCVHACRLASVAGLGGALATILESCGGGPASPSSASALPVINASRSGSVIAVTIDASSPLQTVGSAALVMASGLPVLVARTAQDAFVAVSGLCTHATCTISDFSGSVYLCPCHGSQFSTSGQVLAGPARASLQTYHTTFANSVLTITP
jgi:Rieske Fe-S protein